MTAELNRKIENLIRLGTIAAVDHAARRVVVKTGGNDTDWLKWITPRAGNTRTWDPPTIGEQVMILSPSGVLENGLVMPSIFSDAHDAPSASPSEHVTEYPDGARIAYDHASGALTATGIKTAAIHASESVTADTPLTRITGDAHIGGNVKIDGTLEIDGLVTYHAGMSGDGAGGSAITITGDLIHTGGVLQSNGIVLHTHVHSGVIAGGDDTGGPV